MGLSNAVMLIRGNRRSDLDVKEECVVEEEEAVEVEAAEVVGDVEEQD